MLNFFVGNKLIRPSTKCNCGSSLLYKFGVRMDLYVSEILPFKISAFYLEIAYSRHYFHCLCAESRAKFTSGVEKIYFHGANHPHIRGG